MTITAISESALQHYPQPESSNARERSEGAWSSLPVLLLWMIKDKLDMFDNMQLAAVCRGWNLASVHYPKPLYSVGDGVPWILHRKYGTQWEFISVPRKRKFVVDMPEFDGAMVLCSKEGWILLRTMPTHKKTSSEFVETPLMVNPLTRAIIELPELTGIRRYDGVFTTCGGYPRCVFLVINEPKSDVIIKTACPGDKVWTSHNFPPLGRACSILRGFVAVGMKVCCKDLFSNHVTVFDVANNTLRDFAPISSCGFLGEHDGKLIYVDHRCIEDAYDFTTYAVYMYNEAASPTFWERLSDGAVTDTSWYLQFNCSCITAKGKGLKVYHLREELTTVVDVHDLVGGSVETVPVPFPEDEYPRWIGIG